MTASSATVSPAAAQLRGDLGQIDERLDSRYSVQDADNVCTYIENGETDAVIRRAVTSRFSERVDGDLSSSDTDALVDAVTTYCKD